MSRTTSLYLDAIDGDQTGGGIHRGRVQEVEEKDRLDHSVSSLFPWMIYNGS